MGRTAPILLPRNNQASDRAYICRPGGRTTGVGASRRCTLIEGAEIQRNLDNLESLQRCSSAGVSSVDASGIYIAICLHGLRNAGLKF